jgi:transposase
MSRWATTIVLTIEERRELQRRVRARTSSQQAAQRARIAPHTVQQWRDRFAAGGLTGLEDRPHRPPPREYSAQRQARILVVACQSPAELGWSGQTHWSVRDLARYLGEHPELGVGRPSKSTVGKILQAADLRLERL